MCLCFSSHKLGSLLRFSFWFVVGLWNSVNENQTVKEAAQETFPAGNDQWSIIRRREEKVQKSRLPPLITCFSTHLWFSLFIPPSLLPSSIHPFTPSGGRPPNLRRFLLPPPFFITWSLFFYKRPRSSSSVSPPLFIFILYLSFPFGLIVFFSLCLPHITRTPHLAAFSVPPPFLPPHRLPTQPHLPWLLFLSSGAPSIRLSGAASGRLLATIFHRQPAKQLTAQPPPGNCFGCERNFKHSHTASPGPPPKHRFPPRLSRRSLHTSLCFSIRLYVCLLKRCPVHSFLYFGWLRPERASISPYRCTRLWCSLFSYTSPTAISSSPFPSSRSYLLLYDPRGTRCGAESLMNREGRRCRRAEG